MGDIYPKYVAQWCRCLYFQFCACIPGGTSRSLSSIGSGMCGGEGIDLRERWAQEPFAPKGCHDKSGINQLERCRPSGGSELKRWTWTGWWGGFLGVQDSENQWEGWSDRSARSRKWEHKRERVGLTARIMGCWGGRDRPDWNQESVVEPWKGSVWSSGGLQTREGSGTRSWSRDIA